MPRLRALGVSAGGCSGVKVFLRVREPFAWYVSWFRWEAGYRGLVRLNESTLPANLQARAWLASRTRTLEPCGSSAGL